MNFVIKTLNRLARNNYAGAGVANEESYFLLFGKGRKGRCIGKMLSQDNVFPRSVRVNRHHLKRFTNNISPSRKLYIDSFDSLTVGWKRKGEILSLNQNNL